MVAVDTQRAYRVTLRRTRTVNVIRQAGQLRSFTLHTDKDLEGARAHVQHNDCDYNRPWAIESIVEIQP